MAGKKGRSGRKRTRQNMRPIMVWLDEDTFSKKHTLHVGWRQLIDWGIINADKMSKEELCQKK